MTDSLLYAKILPHLRRSINVAYLENEPHDIRLNHLERGLELSGFEMDEEFFTTTMTTTTAAVNKQTPKEMPNSNEQFADTAKIQGM